MVGIAGELEVLVRRIVREEIAVAQAEQPAATEPGERLLRLADVAERTGFSVTTVRRWIAADGLPTVVAPGSVPGREEKRVRLSDLDDWLAALPSRRSAAPTPFQQKVAERLRRRGLGKTASKKVRAAR